MKSNQSKILNNGVLFFALVILLAMVVKWLAAPDYKMRNAEVLEIVTGEEQNILPWQLRDLIRNNELKDHLLIDLREPAAYNRGSLPGAINIPFKDVLDRKSLKQFKKSGATVILFSGDESQASAASALLTAKGLTNIRMLTNNYGFLKTQVLESFNPAAAYSKSESARYDYNRFFRTGGSSDIQTPRAQPRIIQTEIIQAQGGC
jgi:sulfur-carrier protein adenylyltransferase/sulfurtransferase